MPEVNTLFRVVIVGGGFGGIATAMRLAKDSRFAITLISENNRFEYHAALYRSATGRSFGEVAIPLDDIFESYENVEVVVDRIEKVEPYIKAVVGAAGKYHYDHLVLALGAVTEYYGISGLEKFSYGIKTIDQAIAFKRHLHEEISSGKPDLNYIVVGGGPTGVELAGELIRYLKVLRRRHRLRSKRFNVVLVEASGRLLGALPEDFSKRITKRLRALGVKIYLNTAVNAETASSLILPEGDIKTHTVIWTAGMTNNPFFSKHINYFKLLKGKKVQVDSYLQGLTDVYIVGDGASTLYSGMAQTALHDGKYVAENLIRRYNGVALKPYQPAKPVYAVPVGTKWAGVVWGDRQFFGRIGWALRRAADFRIFLRLLPFRKALAAWLAGNTQFEGCQECAPRLRVVS